MSKFAISYQDILDAAGRLKNKAYRTAVVSHPILDHMAGMKVYLKLECQQKVGAFKYRGAYNRLSALSESERKKGVVAFSSGNHAQGVSRAAKELGMSAIIIMPHDAPAIKVAGVKRDGAQIIGYDRITESREDIAAEIAKRDGRIVVPSFDDPYIMAGQGTCGLEISQDISNGSLDTQSIIIPMGGGGLSSGTSLAVGTHHPDVKIYGAEPTDYNDHQSSILKGERVHLKSSPPTLCDALQTPAPGKLTFPINKHYITRVFTSEDRACLMAMGIMKASTGVIGEPGGVVGLAAVLSGEFKRETGHNSVCVVISGGNVDPVIIKRADDYLNAP